MRERNGLRRAAWRELWPATVFALVLALVTIVPGITDDRPHSPWALLVLLPAALHAGLVVGRCSPGSLAFLLARPFARDRLLATRLAPAMLSLSCASMIIAGVVLARTPAVSTTIELALAFAVVVLAFGCATVGALSSDREPLGFGIGVLLFCAMPIAMIWILELLEITGARVVTAHPLALIAVIALEIVACARAARRLWCESLPVRDAAAVKRLLLGAASGWLPAQLLSVALAWHSATPQEAIPFVLLGHDARGPIVAAGSPGGDVDAVLAGSDVVLDADGIGGDRPDIRAAVVQGDRLAVALVFADESCAVVLVDPRNGIRRLREPCGRMSFSGSGRTLAILRDDSLALVDIEHAIVRARREHVRGLLGWHDEEVFIRTTEGIAVGDRMLTNLRSLGAVVSRDEQHVAFRLELASRGRDSLLQDYGPAVVASVGLDGTSTFFVLPLQQPHLIGWLDAEHVVLSGVTTRERAIVVVSTRTRAILHELPVRYGLAITHVDGPPDGPWLVTRSGSMLEAIAADGTVLWQQAIPTLERDPADVRRWTIVDDEVIGVDPLGQPWHHELPWEAPR